MHAQAVSDCWLFAGPTLYRANGTMLSLPPEIRLRPPVARGDIEKLVAAENREMPGIVVLVDGLFHQSLAVGHAEIREALKAGWRLYGLSSLGAIRAYEMRFHGMQGFGQVYRRFEEEEDFQDDEVALMHDSDAPYRALSEPLVHCRVALEEWTQAGWLSASAHTEIIAQLKSLWFGERHLSLFSELVLAKAESHARQPLTQALADFDRYRIKTHDLADFLLQAPWRTIEPDRA